MANKIAAQMSTLITLDSSKVTESLRTIRNMSRAAKTEAQANAEALRATGDSIGAAKSSWEGYRTQLELSQKRLKMLENQHKELADLLSDKEENLKSLSTRIERLSNLRDIARDKLKELKKSEDASTESIKNQKQVYEDLKKELQDTRRQYNQLNSGKVDEKFAKQSQQLANAQLQQAKLEQQANKSRDAYLRQGAGIDQLQSQYQKIQQSSRAYIDRLNAENRQASSTVASYNAHRQALANLKSQYDAQGFVLDSVRAKYGENSEQYEKEKIQLDQIQAKMATTQRETIAMSSTVARIRPTGITSIDNSLTNLRDHTARLHDFMAQKFDSIKQHAIGIGVGIGVAGSQLVQGAREAGDLQNEYLHTQNLLVTGGEKQAEAVRNVKEMQKDGRDMSIRYGQSQKEIAEAYQELTKRGYSSAQSLGAMKSMIQASVASGDPLMDVVNSSTAAIEAFGMKSNSTAGMLKNTKTALNQMTYAADMTATDFPKMSTALEYAGPQAKALGYSIGETASAIGILSNNGLEADKAGTGLRKVLNSLVNPSKKGQQALKQLHLSMKDFRDESGKLKPMGDIFDMLGEKMRGMSRPKRAQIAQDLFGTTGESAGLILADHANDLNKVTKKTNKASQGEGYVKRLADKNMGSAKMAERQFKASMQAVRMELGSAVLPSLAKATTAMAKFLDSANGKKAMSQLAGTLRNVAQAIISVGTFAAKHTTSIKVMAAALAGLWGTTKILTFMARMREVARILGITRGAFTAMRVAGMALKGGLVTLGIAGVGFLIAKFVQLYKHNAKFRNFIKGIGKVLAAGFKLSLKYSIAGQMINGFKKLYKNNKSFRNFINSIVDVTKKAFKAIADFFKKWVVEPVSHFFKSAYNKIADIGKGSVKNPSKKYASGTSGTIEDQVAMVNDATDDKWREMMLTKDGGLYAFPRKRNLLTYIPADSQVITGQAADILAKQRGYRHFADGQGSKWSPLNSNDFGVVAGIQADENDTIQNEYTVQLDALKREEAAAKAKQQKAIQKANAKANNLIAKAKAIMDQAVKKADQVQAVALANAKAVLAQAQANAERTKKENEQKAQAEYQQKLARYDQSAKQRKQNIMDTLNRRNHQYWATYTSQKATIEKSKASKKEKQQRLEKAYDEYNTKYERAATSMTNSMYQLGQTQAKERTNAKKTLDARRAQLATTLQNARKNAQAASEKATIEAQKQHYDSTFEANTAFTSAQNSANSEKSKSIATANQVYTKAMQQIAKQRQAIQKWNQQTTADAAYASGTSGTSADQIAIVNDASSSNWLEAMYYKGRLSLFPAKRNLLTFVPKGAQILNGDNTAQLFGQSVNKFADGVGSLNDSSLLIKNINSAGDQEHAEERKKFIAELKQQMQQYLQQISQTMQELQSQMAQARATFQQALNQAAAAYTKAINDAKFTLSSALVDADNKINSSDASTHNEGIQARGQAYANYSQQLQQAQEAKNKQDAQAQATLNTASANFNRKMNIANQNRQRLQQWYHSNIAQADKAFATYANGGIADRPSIFGEAGPEVAIPLDSMKQGAAWSLMQKVVSYFAGDDSQSARGSARGAGGSETDQALNQKFDKLISLVSQLVTGQGAQIEATKKVQGYDSDKSFDDFNSKFRTAQTSGLTY